MIANIRGGLGTQVVELLGAYTLARRTMQTITGIHVSAGTVHPAGRTNYVSRIFGGIAPVTVTQETLKVGVFRRPRLLELILDHGWLNLQELGPILDPVDLLSCSRVLHVRTGNREPVSLDTYARYRDENPGVHVIGNGAMVAGDPVADWFTALRAEELVTSATTFTLSTLFIDPSKRVRLWPNEEYDVWLRPLKAGGWFPNLEWIT